MTKRRDLVDLDKRYVWRPYTEMGHYQTSGDPIVVASGERVWLYDVSGVRYFDACSSWWTAALGHQHPRLVRALTEQAEKLAHCAYAGVAHEPAVRLAKELLDTLPSGLARVFYTDNGSTSVEVAVKAVAQFWHQNGHPKKQRFVSLEGAFHGETLAPTSLGGIEVFRRPFGGLIFDCVRVSSPADGGHARAFSELEQLLRCEHETLAGCVIEPLVQGAAGMKMYPAAYVKDLAEVCRKHDVFLIVDEVFTGLGRTGAMWALDHADVQADVVCVGKAFSSIVPMGAAIFSERVFNGFMGSGERALLYGHTFYGNPIGASIAREVLATLREEKVVERAQPMMQRLNQRFLRMNQLPRVSGARALGMIGAFDLSGSDASIGDETDSYLRTAGWLVADKARERGVYLRPLGNTIYVCPPLITTLDEVDWLCDALEDSVRAAFAL